MKLVIISLLLVGLAAGMYLVKNQNTTTQSKAATSIISAFEVRDSNGTVSQCRENTENGVPICEVETLDFTISLKDPKVLQSLPTD